MTLRLAPATTLLIPRATTLAACALLLAGCVHSTHRTTDAVHDTDLTFDDYDGAVSFGPASGEDYALPPVDVHEFDTELVTAQGGVRLIDGETWLDASDVERNQLLLDAEKTLPADATLVLVVATGEVWTLGPNAGTMIQSGAVTEWSGADYDDLAEYYLEPAPSKITQSTFAALSDVGPLNGVQPPYFIHDIGPVGLKEIQSAYGLAVLAPPQWIGVTPAQRAQELNAIDRFLEHTPHFQGDGNRPVFGVSIPWGVVYAVPQHNYQNLIGWHALQPWTAEQIGSLPYVLPDTGRAIRNEPTITLDIERRF